MDNNYLLLRKGYRSLAFWISVILFVICSFITLYSNMGIDNVKTVARSNMDMFYYSVMYFNIVINTIAPLFAVISAYSIIFANKDQIISNRIFNKYLISSGILGGSVFIISEFIILLILSIIYPATFTVNINTNGTFNIFFNNKLIYFLMFFINSFLIGCLYAMLGFLISYRSKHSSNAVIIPLFIYFARLYYPFKDATLLNYMPIDTFDIASKNRSIWSHLISLCLIVLIIAVLAIYKKTKYINLRKESK